METVKTKEIMVRRPFKRALPYGYKSGGESDFKNIMIEPADYIRYQIITQADFMREFEPSSHSINDPAFYPDIIHEDPDGKKYIEYVDRCSFAFQRIITIKQLAHLCGNNIQFELYDSRATREWSDEKRKEIFREYRKGWAIKDMEIAWYESAKSVKTTGDTAFVGFLNKGKFGWKVLSYANGDTLYPHFDSLTGELVLFARGYNQVDADGRTVSRWLEVWDDEYFYRFREDHYGIVNKSKTIIKKIFGLESYSVVSVEKHGFNFIPVAYKRNEEGACWTNSQDTIEEFEVAFSRLSQNTAAFGFPVWYFKGNDISVAGDPLKGSIKTIVIPDKDGEVGAIPGQDASNSFSTQLDKLYKLIYEQSFAVIPPDLKSGDLPGVAVKLLYSPAYENAMKDANEFSKFINQMRKIYAFGYGVEIEMMIDFMQLEVYSWIKPYIHQNWTETITNLATSVQNGFLSRQRANEVADEYSTSTDWDTILREQKQKQQEEIQKQIEIEETKTTVNPETE